MPADDLGASAFAGTDGYRKKNDYYYRLLGATLTQVIPEGKRILDLGCGTGEFLNLLRPCYGVGVDKNADTIGIAARRYPHLNFIVGDIEELIIEEKPFDYIVISNVIGYIKDVHKFFLSLKRYCAPETRIVIIYYNYLWEPALKFAEKIGLKMREPLLNWLALSDFENLMYVTGFELIRKKQDVLLPFYVPVISNVCNRFIVNLPFFWRLGLVGTVVARPVMSEPNMSGLSCSVIVPARNERGNIEDLVRRIPEMGSSTEIIFVEGHSRDGTSEEISAVISAHPAKNIRLLTQDGEGKADAVRKGLGYASGDILMILDADLSVSPEELPKFYDAVASGKGDLVMGCRLVYQLEDESMRFLNLLGNKFFSMAFSYLLGQRIKDTLCGTKVFKRKHYQSIVQNRAFFGDFDPFGDFELIFGASKANLRILEIPVRYHARRYGTTQIKRFQHGFLLLKMLGIAIRKLKFI
ncbi:MAG: glycosyltransferase [Nitrospirae bacterium]|nr:glycosyltransferase [Nitrospirota bacterium]